MGLFRSVTVSGSSGPHPMWALADYPPGTPLPEPPTPDFGVFPRWLRPLARRRWAKQSALRRAWMGELREHRFRAAAEPPRPLQLSPVRLRGRHKRRYEQQLVEVYAQRLFRWERRGGRDAEEDRGA